MEMQTKFKENDLNNKFNGSIIQKYHKTTLWFKIFSER